MIAKVGKDKALETEIVMVDKDGLEIYVNTNMEVHARMKKQC
jgi:hypothetical protein